MRHSRERNPTDEPPVKRKNFNKGSLSGEGPQQNPKKDSNQAPDWKKNGRKDSWKKTRASGYKTTLDRGSVHLKKERIREQKILFQGGSCS